jgi:ribosomal protein L7/L12
MGTDGLKENEVSLPEAAVAALQRGNRIAAIKALRIGRNMGLKEAKALVDEYVQARPELQQSFAAAWQRTLSMNLVWTIVIVAVLLLLLRFFSRA